MLQYENVLVGETGRRGGVGWWGRGRGKEGKAWKVWKEKWYTNQKRSSDKSVEYLAVRITFKVNLNVFINTNIYPAMFYINQHKRSRTKLYINTISQTKITSNWLTGHTTFYAIYRVILRAAAEPFDTLTEVTGML